MLEVQLVRRSRNGVVIPVARSDKRELVNHVAQAITKEMEAWRFRDEVLDDLAQRERKTLAEVLRAEGVKP